jgi:hypothetical protein
VEAVEVKEEDSELAKAEALLADSQHHKQLVRTTFNFPNA